MSNRYTARLTPGAPTYEVANPSGLTVCAGWSTRQAAQDSADHHTALAARRFAVNTLTGPQHDFYQAAKGDGAVVSRTGYSLQVARRLAAKHLVTLTETGPGSWRAAHQPDVAPFLPAPIEEPVTDEPADEPAPETPGARTVNAYTYWALQGIPAGPVLTMERRATLGFWTVEERYDVTLLRDAPPAEVRELLVTIVADLLDFADMDDPAPLFEAAESELGTTVNLMPVLCVIGDPTDLLACTLAALYAYAERLDLSHQAIAASGYQRWADARPTRQDHKARRAGE